MFVETQVLEIPWNAGKNPLEIQKFSTYSAQPNKALAQQILNFVVSNHRVFVHFPPKKKTGGKMNI